MSTVSGRTDRNNSIPRQNGQTLQVEELSWRGVSPFSAPHMLQVPAEGSSFAFASPAG
jgi:hypothetical protein